jgi:beta-N-acetylhexosaminidase
MQSMKSLLLLIFMAIQLPFVHAFSVREKMDQMTLEQKVGQLLLVGFRGTQVAGNQEILQALSRAHVGSVIYFDYDATSRTRGRNIQSPTQLRALSTDLQTLNSRYNSVPLFISVDEEGGLVSRLHPRYGFLAKRKPSDLTDLSLRVARREMAALAQELQAMGINLNFAPVTDVNVNPQNPVIGRLGRSFSSDANRVAEMAGEFIQAQNHHDVISVLKHFPGHGSSDSDSHLGVVDVSNSWIDEELIPYRTLIAQGHAQMIMTAHIYQRQLDPEYPATLSQSILQGVLRDQLGFQGVIISDDMNMGAITDQFGFDEAIVLALRAGVDILLLGNNLLYDPGLALKAHQAIMKALERGDVSEARIDQSVERILQLKRDRLVL